MTSKQFCSGAVFTSLAVGVVAAFAAPTSTTIPLGASHGDSIRFGGGAAVPLSPTSYLVATRGPGKDRQNVNGFNKNLLFDGKKGRLTVSGADPGRPDATLIPISVTSDDVYFGQNVVGETRKSGVRFKAPK